MTTILQITVSCDIGDVKRVPLVKRLNLSIDYQYHEHSRAFSDDCLSPAISLLPPAFLPLEYSSSFSRIYSFFSFIHPSASGSIHISPNYEIFSRPWTIIFIDIFTVVSVVCTDGGSKMNNYNMNNLKCVLWYVGQSLLFQLIINSVSESVLGLSVLEPRC